ncbi:MAG TPA: hypothetical protein VFP68_16045 [Burkholderiaceae bacterium]|nr:hypothetical protein [Burkholderiaceae bacterium]
MLALTLDMPLLQPPHWSEPVISYRHEVIAEPCEPARHAYLRIRYEAGNALTTGLETVPSRKDPLAGYQPKTELGKTLLALRQAFVANGGQLLSGEALDKELHSRRGGVSDV